MRTGILVAVMAAVTILLRALPFLIFRRRTPAFIAWLGEVLPAAIIGMLVVYCFKDVSWSSGTHGLPEILGHTPSVIEYSAIGNHSLCIACLNRLFQV